MCWGANDRVVFYRVTARILTNVVTYGRRCFIPKTSSLMDDVFLFPNVVAKQRHERTGRESSSHSLRYRKAGT